MQEMQYQNISFSGFGDHSDNNDSKIQAQNIYDKLCTVCKPFQSCTFET